MSVPIPKDADGRIARACPNDDCSPGYFKIKPGTGLTGQTEAFCPYCRESAKPNGFTTKEQQRYAKDHLVREATDGVNRMFKEALGLGHSNRRTLGSGGLISMEISYKPGTPRPVRRPMEDQVRRDVICPHCTLEHSVYGLATWCADCGVDIFLTHVDAELAVVAAMLADVERRRSLLGERVAAKDLENCLEDIVSIFEAVMKIMVRRVMQKRGVASDEIETALRKAGNCFQGIGRTVEFLRTQLDLPDLPGVTAEEREALRDIFEKRHPITHNLGVVDRKYLDNAAGAVQEGREVSVTPKEISLAMTISKTAFQAMVANLSLEFQKI